MKDLTNTNWYKVKDRLGHLRTRLNTEININHLEFKLAQILGVGLDRPVDIKLNQLSRIAKSATNIK